MRPFWSVRFLYTETVVVARGLVGVFRIEPRTSLSSIKLDVSSLKVCLDGEFNVPDLVESG